LKRNFIHKSTYLQRCIKKATVKQWLDHIWYVFNVNPGDQGSPMTFFVLLYNNGVSVGVYVCL
jgi:hypothetical protein